MNMHAIFVASIERNFFYAIIYFKPMDPVFLIDESINNI